MDAWFYILRLRSGRLYCGATKDIERRMREHSEKKACRTTSSDPIDALVYSETFNTYPEALKREAEVKRWPRKKKEALVAGNIDTV
jgi:putative endonuclease